MILHDQLLIVVSKINLSLGSISTKHVLIYLCVIVGYGLRYASGCDMILQVFCYSYWVGCVVDRKITS